MSGCVSMHGEYGDHVLAGPRADRFVCQRCGVLDEDGIMNALDAAEERLAAVEAITEDGNVPPPAWREGYEGALRAIRNALANPASVLHPVEHIAQGVPVTSEREETK